MSDHSSDIIRALERRIREYGVHIRLKSTVKSLYTDNGRVSGLYLQDGSLHRGDAVIVATGGLSYPSTGSDGDGYRFAGECGHQVTELAPSLVPPAHEGGVYPQNAGTFPEKCHTDRKKTEKRFSIRISEK